LGKILTHSPHDCCKVLQVQDIQIEISIKNEKPYNHTLTLISFENIGSRAKPGEGSRGGPPEAEEK
jgi:hypothetical protein